MNKTWTLEYQRNWKRAWRLREPAKVMLHQAKARSKKLGVPFDLVLEDIVVPSLCPVLNIPLVVQVEHQSDNSPSLDRLDPLGGYVKGNIAVISLRANQIKSNATVSELRRIADWMVERGRQEN